MGESLGGLIKPAVDGTAQSLSNYADSAIKCAETIQNWLDVNNQTVITIKSLGLTLASSAMGYMAVKTSADALTASSIGKR